MELIYFYIKRFINKPIRRRSINNEGAGFIIENQGINFSDLFNCSFEISNSKMGYGRLIIEKSKKMKSQKFYGENINSLKMLVGENGSGKTTLMDLVGLTRDDRAQIAIIPKGMGFKTVSQISNNKELINEYALLYHDIIDGEDVFIIEMFSDIRKNIKSWIINFDFDLVSAMNKSPIAVVTKYDFNNKQFSKRGEGHIFDYPERKSNISEDLRILYYSYNHSSRHSNKNDDENYMFKRKKLEFGSNSPNDYIQIIKCLFEEEEEFKELRESFHSAHSITISYSYKDKWTNNHNGDIHNKIREIINEKIYYEKSKTKKDYFIKALIKHSILDIISNIEAEVEERFDSESLEKNLYDSGYYKLIDTLLVDKFIELIDSIQDNIELSDDEPGVIESRMFDKNSILKLILLFFENIDGFKSIYSEQNKSMDENVEWYSILSGFMHSIIAAIYNLDDSGYYTSLVEVIDNLQELDTVYFENESIIIDKLSYEKATISNIYILLNTLQRYKDEEFNIPNDINNRIRLSLNGVSDGEMVKIDIFSKLVAQVRNNREAKTILLILDEPDQRLHPEWSREFMYELLTTLNNLRLKRLDKETFIKFQVILSSHSAFLLSDIRHIDTCVLAKGYRGATKKQFTSIITQPQHKTFGANIYDLFKVHFMLKETMGKFALKKMEQEFDFLKLSENDFMMALNESPDVIKSNMKKAIELVGLVGEKVIHDSIIEELEIRQSWMIDIEQPLEKNEAYDSLLKDYGELSTTQKKQFIQKLLEVDI